MLLSEAIDMTIRRTGLNLSNTDNRNQARFYLNAISNRIVGRAKWWWAYKTADLTTTSTLTVSNITLGTFEAGERITGGTSGKTATIATSYDAANYSTAIHYHTPSVSTDFNSGETITGGLSGANATAGADVVTRTYVLASDVLTPFSFVDETNGETLPFKGWDWFDAIDPEQDATGDVDAITIEGIDATTGLITIAMYPLPSTSSETIRYRYLSYIPDWTDSNDTDNLDKYLPQILQPALYFGAAELYCQEKGDSESGNENRSEYADVIDTALDQNLRIWGNRNFRRMGDEGLGNGFNFTVNEGSLSA